MTVKTKSVSEAEAQEANDAVHKIMRLLAEFKDDNKINTILIGVICGFSISGLGNHLKEGTLPKKTEVEEAFSEYMNEFKRCAEHMFNDLLIRNKIYKE